MDKVNFIEYTKLPGIINDRLHFMFTSGKGSRRIGKSSSPEKASPGLKVQDYVTEKSFEENLVTIFAGDLDSKMKFTFEM